MIEAIEKPLPTDTAYKAVDFIETYTGRAFYPLLPRAQDITVIDIAHALSQQCRYGGHATFFYSTAQHCCLLADYVMGPCGGTPIDGLQILHHDDAEAYLVDIQRPVKQFMPEFRKWDYGIQMCIRTWLGLDGIAIPSWQDEVDSRIIHDERAQVMSVSGLDWKHDGAPLGIFIEPWTSAYAEQQFLMRHAAFTYKIFGKHQYLRSGWGVPMNSLFRNVPFRTVGGDVIPNGEPDARIITDLLEVDLRGGCGRVAMRSPNGMMVRDTNAGKFPRPAWRFVHGAFQLETPESNGVTPQFPEDDE